MKKLYIILSLVLLLLIGTWFFINNRADSELNGLDKKSWELAKIVYSDETEMLPNKTGDFSITFKQDGKFSSETDCNTTGGEYVSEGNLITFKNIFSTKMFCEGSKEEEFKTALVNARTFFFDQDGGLVIELDLDSGSMFFK
ncbi:MAG: META domain-containing protein [Patescibacteria group bacterium]